MASGPHTFVVLGVFSAEQFQGNRLAVVAVRGNALAQQTKESIAKEFGFTGTVFIHDAPNPKLPRRIEIFTDKGEELTFSGHCILGTIHYIFQCCETGSTSDPDRKWTTTLMTKAGPLQASYNWSRKVALCYIPQAFHIHEKKVGFAKILNVQPQIQIVPTMEKCKEQTYPVVSIVKGMTFSLIDLTEAPEVLAALEAGKAPDTELDKEWEQGYIGAIYYKMRGMLVQEGEPTIHSIQARVITKGVEDPGTGSACSALACYLAFQMDSTQESKPDTLESSMDQVVRKTSNVTLQGDKTRTERHIYAVQQGLEIGRACTLAVEVELQVESDGAKKIKNVILSGRASFFARGELMRA